MVFVSTVAFFELDSELQQGHGSLSNSSSAAWAAALSEELTVCLVPYRKARLLAQ